MAMIIPGKGRHVYEAPSRKGRDDYGGIAAGQTNATAIGIAGIERGEPAKADRRAESATDQSSSSPRR
jgi:hypothetical protein